MRIPISSGALGVLTLVLTVGSTLRAQETLQMSIATTYVARDDEGERAVEEVARLAYDYFNRLSRSSSYGPVIS